MNHSKFVLKIEKEENKMKIQVLCHSSIKIVSDIIIYSDPFKIKEEKNDADLVIITHSHYDLFSEEDIRKVKKDNTKICITNDLLDRTQQLGFAKTDIIIVEPNNHYELLGVKLDTIPAYNTNKNFHPKENNWVSYLLQLEGMTIYVAGDTDITEENKKVKCDIALVPIGGTYTMTYGEAAELMNKIKPKIAIPMHYGEIVGKKEDALQFKKQIDQDIQVNIQI